MGTIFSVVQIYLIFTQATIVLAPFSEHTRCYVVATCCGDKSGQCTGQEISCWNKLCDTHSNKLLCVNRRIFVKIFLSAIEFYCNQSHKFSLIRFCETCCGDKILLRRQRLLCDVSKGCVAATCLFQYKVNSLKILANPKSQSFITPSLVIRMFSGFTSLWTHWKRTQKTPSDMKRSSVAYMSMYVCWEREVWTYSLTKLGPHIYYSPTKKVKKKVHTSQRPKGPELIPVSLAQSMPRNIATPP